MDYIFDTHVFDSIVAGDLSLDDLKSAKSRGDRFYVTHIQVDEINRCKDENKRATLNLLMLKVSPEVAVTETAIWGVSRWGEAKWGTKGFYEQLKQGNLKHTEDALIGEVAIVNSFTLVTNDHDLMKKVIKLSGKAISINEYRRNINESHG